jgi:hypothetical protein
MVGLASCLGEVMTPTFQGEMQFRRYSDTSTQGQQVVFAVHSREELESFIGKEGKRFMAVFVEIGDDEQPVNGKEIAKPKEREHLGELCFKAVMWCNDREFQEWVGARTGTSSPMDADKAKQFILMKCEVDSRKDLDTNPEAGSKFRAYIVSPWQKYQMARRSA